VRAAALLIDERAGEAVLDILLPAAPWGVHVRTREDELELVCREPPPRELLLRAAGGALRGLRYLELPDDPAARCRGTAREPPAHAPLPGGGEAISRSVTLDDGARFALLHVPGLFRFDVCPAQDTLRTLLRNLTSPTAPVTYEQEGSSPLLVGSPVATAALGPRPLALDVRFTLDGRRVGVTLVATQDPASGCTSFTAQATVRPFSPA